MVLKDKKKLVTPGLDNSNYFKVKYYYITIIKINSFKNSDKVNVDSLA